MHVLYSPWFTSIIEGYTTLFACSASPVPKAVIGATWRGLARPGQDTLTKTFATWEGPIPPQIAKLFVRATLPGLVTYSQPPPD